MSLQVSVDFNPLDRKLGKLAAAVTDASTPLRRWAGWYGQQVWQARARHTFGSDYEAPTEFRGQVWPGIEPQYIRKTGPEADRRVPPWGGVRRLRGAVNWSSSDIATGRKQYRRADRVYGTVRGVKRPSGKRVSRVSVVGGDTNAMFREFTRNPALSPDRRVVTLSSTRVYAKRFNRRRPFAFVNRGDQVMFQRFCEEWLKSLARASR